jgi:hypothetical protein
MNWTINARFTAAQGDLFYVGLRTIVINHLNLTHTGRSLGSHPDLLTVKFFKRQGIYNDEFMQGIYRLWKVLRENRGTEFRASLDYGQTAACALAVRSAVRQLRHRHIVAWTAGIETTADRSVQRLEALRKRLKRRITKTKGRQFFRELAISWQEHLRWLRLNVLSCPCLVRRPNLTYKFSQLLINQMVHVTRSDLRLRGLEIPAEPLLRKLVRDALKNVRRLRTPWTVPLLSRNPQIAAFWFGNYVERRMASGPRS